MNRQTVTTPIINYFFEWSSEETKQLSDELHVMHILPRVYKLSDKEFMKSQLGRQTYCEQLSYKNWVWEQNNWRVYVSARGISFEVEKNLTKQQVKNAWNDFRYKIGADKYTYEQIIKIFKSDQITNV